MPPRQRRSASFSRACRRSPADQRLHQCGSFGFSVEQRLQAVVGVNEIDLIVRNARASSASMAA